MHFINQSVANLRKKPEEILHNDYRHDDNRLTQANQGDPVIVHQKRGVWLWVSLPEQLCLQNRVWRPYQGYLHASEVTTRSIKRPFYSFTKKVDPTELLQKIDSYIALPYLWGGCSPAMQDRVASVDCSGLIYQLCKGVGKLVPRDAHDQFFATKQSKDKPKPADLLFLRPLGSQGRITHVMMLVDEEHYLEAPESGKCVRLLKRGKEIWEERGVFHIFDRKKHYLGTHGRLL